MIKLYTTHCRKCKILESKLIEKQVAFEIEDDEAVLTDLGFDFMPVLEIDGKRLNYMDAVSYVNSL